MKAVQMMRMTTWMLMVTTSNRRLLGRLVLRAFDSQLGGCEFDSLPSRCWVTTLGKLFTPVCVCRSQWSSGSVHGCGVRGPRIESHCEWLCLSPQWCCLHLHYHNCFTALLPGPPGWAGARRELLDFMLSYLPLFAVMSDLNCVNFDVINGEIYPTRMWANAQPDGRPAEHRWCPLFDATKFGWRSLLDVVQ